MEGAQAEVVGTSLFQLYVASHHLDDIDAIQQILQKALRYHKCLATRSVEAPITW